MPTYFRLLQSEDISDDLYAERHLRCEIAEKKKFCTFQNSQRRVRNRHDSSASGNTPATPGPQTSVIAVPESENIGTSLTVLSTDQAGSSASLTSLNRTIEEEEVRVRKRSGSCSSRTEELKEEARNISNRRRTGSISGSQSNGMPGPGRGRGRSQSICDMEVVYEVTYFPWEERRFPLDDTGYEQLFKESPYVENAYVPRQTRRSADTSGVRVEGIPSTPQTSRPCSPSQSSSSSTIIEEDPNDPEWTIVNESEGKSERRPSIVLKLAKR